MKKKIPMLLSLVMSVSSLAACNLGKSSEHTHTFSDKYTNNATHHWYAATCEHGEEKKDYAEHKDEGQDGKCDVCAYEMGHTHTFSDTFSKNDTHHWYDATCLHTDEKSGYELHTDANTDGVCDVCESHVHVVNDAGYCEGCKTQVVPIDENNIESVINAAVAQSASINGGKIEYTFNSTAKSIVDNEGKNAYSKLKSTTDYTLGTDAAFVRIFSDSEVYNKSDFGGIWQLGKATSMTDTWFYTENGAVVGFEELTTSNSDKIIPQFVTADENSLIGCYFAVSTLADGYGAETLLFNLYTLSQEESASNYVVSHDAKNKTFTFSFNSLVINTDTAEGEGDSVRYYETEVSFSYSDDYALTSLNVKCDAYTNDAGTNTGEADVDYDYDQENKTITMRDDAEPDTYTFAVTQNVGERTYKHEKDISVYLPKSFTFDVENNTKIDLKAMDNLEIGFAADPAEYYDMVKANGMVNAKLTCNNGESSSFAFIHIDDDNNKFIVIDNIAVGEYTLSFTYLDEVIWSVSISVTEEIITGDYIPVVITDNNTFDGQLVEFTAPASGAYTFMIPAGFGAVDKDEFEGGGFNMQLYVGPYDNGGSFTVDIAQGDTYAFYVSAPNKGTYNIPYTFEAKDVVSGGDEEDGDFDYDTILFAGNNTVYFSPAEISANEATRTLTITQDSSYSFACDVFVKTVTDSNGNVISRNADFSYDLAAGDYTLTFSMFTMFGNEANFAYSINVKSTAPAAPAPVGNLYEGEENVVEITNNDINNPGYILYNFTPWNDGEYVFTAEFPCIIMDAEGNVLGTNSATLSSYTPYTIKLDVANLFLGGEYSVEIKWIAPLGSQDNPFVLTQLGDYTANYAGNYMAIWYVYTPAEDGVLTITNGSSTASLMCGAAFGFEQSSDPGQALQISVVGGVPYYIGVADWEAMVAVEIPFNVAFTAGAFEHDGTRNEPFVLTLGDITCNVPQWEIVVYAYKASARGTLKATTDSTNFDWNFSDTLNAWENNMTNASVSIDVVEGQMVYLFVSTQDMEADAININVTFEEEVLIDVTTLEGNGSNTTPYTLTGVAKYDMGQVNSYPGYYVSITVDEATTLVFNADVAQLYTTGWALLADTGASYTKTLEAGETFTFIVCMDQGTANVLLTVAIA